MAKKRRRRQAQQQQHPRDGLEGLSTRYDTVVAEGRRIAEEWRRLKLTEDQRCVFDYYSRSEIQQAMMEYVQGRKVSVMRCFRPLYVRIEEPEDILAIALYHTRQKNLWPSFHGQISRVIQDEDRGGHVCDSVIEVDYKRSWSSCFDSTLPYIELLRDFGVYACVKFSGHCSAHVIIPGETLPPESGGGRRVRTQLLECARRVVKHPEKLDRSFSNPAHFLRMAYSLNEQTGLVSMPIAMDQFESFSWRDADPYRVKIVPDWWGAAPFDAQDRIRALLDFFSKSHYAMPRHRQTPAIRAATDAALRGKPIPASKRQREEAQDRPRILHLPQGTKPLLPEQAYQQMLDVGRTEREQCEQLLQNEELRSALLALGPTAPASLAGLAEAHDVSLADAWQAHRWLQHQQVLTQYSDPETQQQIFRASRDRRVQLSGEDVEFLLANPEDIPLLAAYHHTRLGSDENPAFLMSVPRYEPQGHFLLAQDLAFAVDGRGLPGLASEIASQLLDALHSQALQVTAYLTGFAQIHLWVIPLPEVQDERKPDLLDHEIIVEHLRQHTKQNRFAQHHWRVLKRDEFAPIPGSLDLYTGTPCKEIPVNELS